jgi:hypothetical protein
VKTDCGILAGTPRWDEKDVTILAFTPGIPLEWVYAGVGLGVIRRRRLRDMIAAADPTALGALGRENAESVVTGDGWKMIEAVAPGYAGAAPLWTQVELRLDPRSDGEIARVLRVDRHKVRRWRHNSVFCPLTGCRLVPNRGVSIVHSAL